MFLFVSVLGDVNTGFEFFMLRCYSIYRRT